MKHLAHYRRQKYDYNGDDRHRIADKFDELVDIVNELIDLHTPDNRVDEGTDLEQERKSRLADVRERLMREGK